MAIAVAEVLMKAGVDAKEKVIKKMLIQSMKKWGKRDPCAGYGARFAGWLVTPFPKA